MSKENINSNQLAKKTGVKQPVIHRILSGETLDPKVGTISSLAKYFQITIDELIKETVNAPSTIPITTLSNIKALLDNKIESTDRFDIGNTQLNNAVAIQIQDSTMSPRFSEDTVIIMEKNCLPINRDYIIIHLFEKNRTLFRQILFDSDDIYLKPLNSDFPILKICSKYEILGCVNQAYINLRKSNEVF